MNTYKRTTGINWATVSVLVVLIAFWWVAIKFIGLFTSLAISAVVAVGFYLYLFHYKGGVK